jgi:acyl dehydratase
MRQQEIVMVVESLAEQARSLIGSKLDLGLSVDEVCRPLIRYWCEAFEDTNRIYSDDTFATKTRFGGIIAPSALAASIARRPFAALDDGQMFGLIGIVGDKLNLPESVVQRVDYDFLLPLRLGDRVRCVERVVGISDEKVTGLGTGRFVTLERGYHNQRDELLSKATLSFFKYPRGSRRKEHQRATAVGAEAKPGAPSAVASVHPADLTPGPELARVGDALPSMPLTLSVTRMVVMAYVSRDFNPIHHDMEYARANGAPHMIVQWACYAGILARFLTDWAGPSAWIQRISFQMHRMNCPGDALSVTGTVARALDVEQRSLEVTTSIANQNGLTTEGSAVLLLK